MNTYNALLGIPSFGDFVVDPLPIRGVCADQHNDARLAVKLFVNPPLDSCIAAPCYGLPIIVGAWSVPFDHAHVSNLRCPPVVGHVVKAIERTPCHVIAPFWCASVPTPLRLPQPVRVFQTWPRSRSA